MWAGGRELRKSESGRWGGGEKTDGSVRIIVGAGHCRRGRRATHLHDRARPHRVHHRGRRGRTVRRHALLRGLARGGLGALLARLAAARDLRLAAGRAAPRELLLFGGRRVGRRRARAPLERPAHLDHVGVAVVDDLLHRQRVGQAAGVVHVGQGRRAIAGVGVGGGGGGRASPDTSAGTSAGTSAAAAAAARAFGFGWGRTAAAVRRDGRPAPRDAARGRGGLVLLLGHPRRRHRPAAAAVLLGVGDGVVGELAARHAAQVAGAGESAVGRRAGRGGRAGAERAALCEGRRIVVLSLIAMLALF